MYLTAQQLRNARASGLTGKDILALLDADKVVAVREPAQVLSSWRPVWDGVERRGDARRLAEYNEDNGRWQEDTQTSYQTRSLNRQ